MGWLLVKGWSRWQTYRRDRNPPPWIKVHRPLLRDWDWIQLTDAERGQVLQIWLLAADHDGKIPDNPEQLKILAHMQKCPDLNKLIELGFLEHEPGMAPTRQPSDAKLTPGGGPSDAPEAESESKSETPLSCKQGKNAELRAEARTILELLNNKTGRSFKPVDANLKPIMARIREYDADTVRQVIANRCIEWLDNERLSEYLRPKTLFAASNFANYEGALVDPGGAHAKH